MGIVKPLKEAEFRQKPTHKKPNISKQLDHFRNQFYEQQQKDDERLQNRINELKDNLRKQIDDRKARSHDNCFWTKNWPFSQNFEQLKYQK